MATTYAIDVLPLEKQGMSPSEIVAHLKPKTAKGIKCSDAKILLEESGLVVEDPITRDRSGLLVNHYSNMQQGQAKQLLGWFIGHVFGRGEEISSHTQPRATQVVDTIAGLPGAMQPLGQALIELGGGQPHADLTVEAIADMQAEHAANTAEQNRQSDIEAIRAEIENNWINPAISDPASDAATVRAAIKEGL